MTAQTSKLIEDKLVVVKCNITELATDIDHCKKDLDKAYRRYNSALSRRDKLLRDGKYPNNISQITRHTIKAELVALNRKVKQLISIIEGLEIDYREKLNNYNKLNKDYIDLTRDLKN